jgi:hypothetical protein
VWRPFRIPLFQHLAVPDLNKRKNFIGARVECMLLDFKPVCVAAAEPRIRADLARHTSSSEMPSRAVVTRQASPDGLRSVAAAAAPAVLAHADSRLCRRSLAAREFTSCPM